MFSDIMQLYIVRHAGRHSLQKVCRPHKSHLLAAYFKFILRIVALVLYPAAISMGFLFV
jgi:hypothetical protein